MGGRFHKFLNKIMISTFDPYEVAPDQEVNTIMGSVETFAGLIISQYNCDFEFPPELYNSLKGSKDLRSLKWSKHLKHIFQS